MTDLMFSSVLLLIGRTSLLAPSSDQHHGGLEVVGSGEELEVGVVAPEAEVAAASQIVRTDWVGQW